VVSISGAAKKIDYYIPSGHLAIIPIENILIAFGGILILLMALLLILRGYKKKKTQYQFRIEYQELNINSM
jgi:hypothetical protein